MRLRWPHPFWIMLALVTVIVFLAAFTGPSS